MQTRSRIRAFFFALLLYVVAGGVIGYFAYHAYNGDHGLMAKRNYEQDVVRLETELAALKSQRQALEHKVSLLDPRSIDPDLLDEEGRKQLDFINAKDLVLIKGEKMN
ncbi:MULTISPECIES: FtsB family cell division protein [Azorhizobium]|uniref:Putative septum formation initiator n=1 Tax=Azorhizobium caulinodans (strain ATCC 43989 / DSM 5975 / JCM 20966 / LMG 6465 / NBRC 14845 / NCIMB 13405 / ORS 571) TaxID=438753 RepID=A8I4J8_AZOC5|nr:MULTISPECIES: septum formation initiator family protein [Azorhizobium]TDT94754.1 cell division protein FtsB [Azorhizobium sp. AG788]BAF87738.1 putative septum formation initiator [Azorhizobium caulinodans ORS 571]